MATTQIKNGYQGGSDDQLLINPDGSINVNSSGGGGSNASVGLTNTTAPTSATEIGGVDPTGKLQSIKTDVNGNLTLAIENAILAYNEITNVAIGIETTILGYIVVSAISHLKTIAVSGQNIGTVTVYKNSQPIDKQYLYYTNFNLDFIYNDVSVLLGDLIEVKVINNGIDICSFNAKLQIVEGA